MEKQVINIADINAAEARAIALSTADPLETPESTAKAMLAYARLKVTAAILQHQLSELEARLAAANEQHSNISLSARALFQEADATGQLQTKALDMELGSYITTTEKIQSDAFRADFGVTTDEGRYVEATEDLTYHVPKAARPYLKNQVLAVNDRAIKKAIALGQLDPKYNLKTDIQKYGIRSTITIVKEEN